MRRASHRYVGPLERGVDTFLVQKFSTYFRIAAWTSSALPTAPSLRGLGGEKSGDACGAKAKLLHCETAIRFQALNES